MVSTDHKGGGDSPPPPPDQQSPPSATSPPPKDETAPEAADDSKTPDKADHGDAVNDAADATAATEQQQAGTSDAATEAPAATESAAASGANELEQDQGAPPLPSKDDSATSDVTPADNAAVNATNSDDQTSNQPAQSAPKPVPPKPNARRPKKGILKPPPPPAKPTLGNMLRDMVVGSVSGEGPGPSAPHPSQAMNAAVGTLNAWSGRLGLGFGRFGRDTESQQGPPVPPKVPRSRLPPRSMSLRDGGRSTGQQGQAHLSQPAPPAGAGSQSGPPGSPPTKKKQLLKRATFVLPSMSITYPISSYGEPWSQKVLDDRQRVESRQRMLLSTARGSEYWTSMRLIKLYESACRGREEKPRLGIVRALQALPAHPKPRLLHLIVHDIASQGITSPSTQTTSYPIDHHLTRYAAEALADVLAIEWGLTDLRLEKGVVEHEEAIKPILHALLVSGSLPSLSLAGNKKIKAGGWHLLAVFLKRARSLKSLDLSETTWDRKGVDYLVQALNSAPVQNHAMPATSTESETDGDETDDGCNKSPYGLILPPTPMLRSGEDIDSSPAAVQTLRMDNCNFRSSAMEVLANGIRTSDLLHLSLRNNRINHLGAVSLAVMIRDYPDSAAISSLAPLVNSHNDSSLPYVPRAWRQQQGPPRTPNSDNADLPPIPLVTSSSAGGVTSRVVPDGYKPPPAPKHPLVMPGGGYSAIQDGALNAIPAEGKLSHAEQGVASLALQRSVRALDGVERVGRLVTLDLKNNDIGRGVTYIAQVLKRNRTLKVLNLSANRIEPAGLTALAEALKYNSTLETLDLSKNPCCGPSLEGIAALRTMFTVNHTLKRLFLSDTGMTTDGAIDLAEFIPENRGLLHLDLTSNPAIGTAGILAVSSGLKSNKIIRCLDVSIPPNDPNLAELSQSILQSCIRNTELATEALKEGKTRGAQEAMWRPIKKSALVRQVKAAESRRVQAEAAAVVRSVEGQAREHVYTLAPEALVPDAERVIPALEQWYAHPRRDANSPAEDFKPLLERAKALSERLQELAPAEADAEKLERMLGVNDQLVALVAKANTFLPTPPRILLPSQIAFASPAAPVVTPTGAHGRRHMRSVSLEISSPNFSLGESDADESDDDEHLSPSSARRRPEHETPTKSAAKSNRLQADLMEAVADGDGANGAASSIGDIGGGVGGDVGLGIGEADASIPGAEAEGEAEEDPASKAAKEELRRKAECLVDAELAATSASPVSDTSRRWVEEEAEIFRKGTKLGVAESDSESDDETDPSSPSPAAGHSRRSSRGGDSDGDSILLKDAGESGEALKRKILDVDVPRDSPRDVAELNKLVEEECKAKEEEEGE